MERSDVSFPSGGVRCAAWLYRPRTPPPHPAVVMAHGFSGTRAAGLEPYAERFASAGLAVLLFDYRFFGDSEGEPRQLLHVRRQLEDWRAAVACARLLPDVDASRVALWGTSFSGGHVLDLASRDEAIAACVAQVPFADGIDALRAASVRQSFRLTVAGLRDQGRRLMGRPPLMVKAAGPPFTEGLAAAIRVLLGDEVFEAARGRGAQMRPEDALAFALEAARSAA